MSDSVANSSSKEDKDDHDALSSSSDDNEQRWERRKKKEHKKKEHRKRDKKKKKKHDKQERRHNNDDDDSSDDSSDGSSTKEEKRRRRRRRRRKQQQRKEQRKRKRRDKDSNEDAKPRAKRTFIASTDTTISDTVDTKPLAAKALAPPAASVATAPTHKVKKAPMTREEYEALRNTVREVYDEETGRYRLVRGTGEIIERIVSRQHHQSINQQATLGDGKSFAKHVYRQAKR